MNDYLNNYNFFNNFEKNQDFVDKEYKQYVNTTQRLFDPYQGFIRGNMFLDLYDSYKIKEPYNIKPMNNQADMLTYIDSLSFACTDLNLYLDVNPDDKEAINLFNMYRMKKKELMENYQNKYGPLLLSSDSLNAYPWTWNDKPWPWES